MDGLNPVTGETAMAEPQAGPSRVLVEETVQGTVRVDDAPEAQASKDADSMDVDGAESGPAAVAETVTETAQLVEVPVPAPISSAAEAGPSTSGPILPDVAPFQPDPPTSVHGPSASTAIDVTPIRAPSPLAGRQRAYRTGYIYDIMMMLHCQDGYTPTEDTVVDAGDGHPEEPMRIKRIFMRLKEAGLIARMKKLEFEEVTQEQAVQVHTEEHWDKVEGTRGQSSME